MKCKWFIAIGTFLGGVVATIVALVLSKRFKQFSTAKTDIANDLEKGSEKYKAQIKKTADELASDTTQAIKDKFKKAFGG